jgi:hypothetical protein
MIKLLKNIFKRKRKEIKKQSPVSEEFYAVIKLVSGEEIFAVSMTDENDGDPIVILQNPIVMKIITNQRGMFVKAKSWIETSNDDIFIIRMDKIITMTETKDDKLIAIYENYICGNDEDIIDAISSSVSGKVKPSSKMGYISSVKDARKKLEDLYKSQ